MKWFTSRAIPFVMVCLFMPPAVAEQSVVDEVVLAADVINAVFNPREQAVLDAYLEERANDDDDAKGPKHKHGKKEKALPPGLQKKLERGGSLPPGWQKKVERGEVMAPELYRQTRVLPKRYLGELGEQPEGTSVLVLDDRVVRVHDATRTIIDVFFPGQ